MGSIFAVQLWEQMQTEIPALDKQIQSGEFEHILQWLKDKMHRHGMKFTLPELADQVTDSPLKWEPYMAYLRSKAEEVYKLP